MNSRPIRFLHQGRIREIAGEAPTRSVLDWLRENARCTGTKEGCGEGDCGACTVIVAELAEDQPASAGATTVGPLSLRPVNACIRFLPTLDGKALLTVEDLAPAGPCAAVTPQAALHPVQAALRDHHGSQCGFCTPGFAMTLTACYEHHQTRGTRPQRQELADALAGNLCRCTGYRPILQAGERMFDAPAQRLDAEAIAAQLRTLRDNGPLMYEAPAARGDGSAQRFFRPRTLDDLARLRQDLPEARLLAGSTDIGLWVNKQFRELGDIVFLGDVPALRAITEDADGRLHIGAAATLEDAWAALVARWPSLREMWLRFAGPPVRHAGTMGGNVANGSPIGDSPPILMALDASLVLRRGDTTRELPLNSFYLDYMKNRLEPGEFLQTIVVPPPAAGRTVHAWKISKRFDCDISALCGAFAIERDGTHIRDLRLVFGGMAATVRRATAAEAALRGQPWNEDSLRRAQDALDTDFQPLSDLRASQAYRRDAARGLLRRLWLQTRPDGPMTAQATSVWARQEIGE